MAEDCRTTNVTSLFNKGKRKCMTNGTTGLSTSTHFLGR